MAVFLGILGNQTFSCEKHVVVVGWPKPRSTHPCETVEEARDYVTKAKHADPTACAATIYVLQGAQWTAIA